MRITYLIFGIFLGCLFTACKPDFELNASYQDVTVVYGILNHQDSVQYVKIYKGFQSHQQGGVYIDAQNPDSIHYNVNDIEVVLEEYNKGKFIKQMIMTPTNEVVKEDGIFYSGDSRILYKTDEKIKKECSYKIVITNKKTGKVTEGNTPIVGDFSIKSSSQSINMNRNGILSFTKSPSASDSCYEFHISFLYFEVDKETHKVTQGKITKIISQAGEGYDEDKHDSELFIKPYSATFYDDIATALKPNPKVVRYLGKPTLSLAEGYVCIEIEGWAAGSSLKNYIISNKPTSSFVQVNTLFTNMRVVPKEDGSTEGFAFGFFSSKVKCTPRQYISDHSEDSLVNGSKTRHLGFRYRKEYNP